MIMDERNEFADATALDTTGTDTDNIGDIIDLGGTTNYLGGGDHRQMYFVVQVTTTVNFGRFRYGPVQTGIRRYLHDCNGRFGNRSISPLMRSLSPV